VSIVNDGKYAYDSIAGHGGADLGITVARGVVYAWHDPARLDPNVRYRWMDQGEQRFRLRIVPHHGNWAAAEVPRRAAELNQRPHVRSDTYHTGRLGAAATFGAITGDGTTQVVVVKRAEDGSGDIVRVAETAGRPTSVELTILGRCVPVSLGAFKIVTLLFPDDPTCPPVEVDLCEWAPGERPPGQCLPTFAPQSRADGHGG
jgi:alpha-mannosidase